MDVVCCDGSGFVGKVICTYHLDNAFKLAMAWGDTDMAKVILAKKMGKL